MAEQKLFYDYKSRPPSPPLFFHAASTDYNGWNDLPCWIKNRYFWNLASYQNKIIHYFNPKQLFNNNMESENTLLNGVMNPYSSSPAEASGAQKYLLFLFCHFLPRLITFHCLVILEAVVCAWKMFMEYKPL